MNDMPTGTALALPNETGIVAMFASHDAVESVIGRIEQEARDRAKSSDTSTDKSRKAIASLAYDVAKSKTAMDDAGKKLKAESLAYSNAVDAERKVIRDRLDALKVEVRAPLTKWEADESARVAALKDRLDRLTNAQDRISENPSSDTIEALMNRVQAVAIDDTWGEFIADAAKAKDATLATLRLWFTAAVQREAEAAEMAKLRQDVAERLEADRVRMAAEHAEAARVSAEMAETERLAQIEADAQRRAAMAAADAEALARVEAARVANEAAAREAALQRQITEAAEREAQAQRKAAQDVADREAAHLRQLAEVKVAQDRAAQDERDRIAQQRVDAETARARREADTNHRAMIHKSIADALRALSTDWHATPELIANALMEGKIPHVRVEL